LKIEPFELERYQSTWEHHVEINLSESGVHPLTVRELLGGDGDLEGVLEQRLAYTQTNGTVELRELVASMYPGATPDHVEITNGGSEANFVVTWNLVEDGDEVVMMVPNYMQSCGLARAFGANVHAWEMIADHAEGRWRVDLDALGDLVNEKTRLIAVCNPDNPTGARVRPEELDEICRIADRHGAWILSDEIYRGAEIDAHETASLWGRYDRVLVTSSLSKAYGLPGLRIGWVVGPTDVVDELWSYHDYTTIGPSALSDRLARRALEPERRRFILERTRSMLRKNLEKVMAWVQENGDVVHAIAPEAGAMLYVGYRAGIGSEELAERLRLEEGVLLVPGSHYGMGDYFRVGYGGDIGQLMQGLERVARVLRSV